MGKLTAWIFNPLNANSNKCSNTRNLPTNCLSVFDHLLGLALKGLRKIDILLKEGCFVPPDSFAHICLMLYSNKLQVIC